LKSNVNSSRVNPFLLVKDKDIGISSIWDSKLQLQVSHFLLKLEIG